MDLDYLLPPPELRAVLSADDAQPLDLLAGMPAFEHYPWPGQPVVETGRRTFLKAGALALLGLAQPAHAASQLIFSPDSDVETTQDTPLPKKRATAVPAARPSDFWERPRELHLVRQRTNERLKVVYWRDGELVTDAYWQICALMRDVKANVMTQMDPTLFDIMRGIQGYYEAYNWRQPLVILSGYRTKKTNDALENAAKNSMHLYGKAVDLYMPGIPVKDIGALGLYLKQGGVGFYPSNGFTHLDTGRVRVWRG